MAEFTTFKRWRLRDGADERDVVQLVRAAIIPAYARLPGCIKLGLLHVDGTRSYLATQYWESRAARAEVLGSPAYASWLEAYQPALERWHAIMELEEEWETEDVLGDAGCLRCY
ncbi:MAG: antibiotic biosynthesis monooxygenase [Chloroflexota bacterium]|nr:antibiotic biosynthesis monooxygenase [Chloroflexota bacterium]